MKRRTKIRIALLAVLFVALAGLLAWPFVARHRAIARLNTYRAQLKAKGEKLSINELAPAMPLLASNGGPALFAVAARLPSSAWSNFPPAMKYTTPGYGLVAWREEVLPTDDVDDVWPPLRNLLAAHTAESEEIRMCLGEPSLAMQLNYHEGFRLLLPHLARLKGVAQWLSAETILALHKGRPQDALRDLLALAFLTRNYNQEPLMISVLVRVACGSIAVAATWEALQAPGWRDEDLAELQRVWASVDVLRHGESALAMERPMTRMVYAEGRKSYAAVSGMFGGGGSSAGLTELVEIGKDALGNPSKGFRDFVHRYPGYWNWIWLQSYDDELANSKTQQAAIDAIRTAETEHFFTNALKQFDASTARIRQDHPQAGRWLEELNSDGSMLRRFLMRIASFEMQRALLVTGIALKRSALRHGAYPATLAELVPEFRPALPLDPMDGKPLRYRLESERPFLLYAVGEDGVDDGGDPSIPTGNGKNRWKAKDMVWPQPETKENIQHMFEELAKDRQQKRSPDSIENTFRRRYGLAPPSASNTANRTPTQK